MEHVLVDGEVVEVGAGSVVGEVAAGAGAAEEAVETVAAVRRGLGGLHGAVVVAGAQLRGQALQDVDQLPGGVLIEHLRLLHLDDETLASMYETSKLSKGGLPD